MQEAYQSIDSMFNADLSGVDTAFPVLAPAIITCVIAEMSRGETKEKKTPVLNIKLTTLHETKTESGEVKSAGFPLRDMVSLNTTEKYNPLQRLAQIREAVFGDKAGAFGDPSLYVGKEVTVRIKVDSDPEYGKQNRVAAYVRKQA